MADLIQLPLPLPYIEEGYFIQGGQLEPQLILAALRQGLSAEADWPALVGQPLRKAYLEVYMPCWNEREPTTDISYNPIALTFLLRGTQKIPLFLGNGWCNVSALFPAPIPSLMYWTFGSTEAQAMMNAEFPEEPLIFGLERFIYFMPKFCGAPAARAFQYFVHPFALIFFEHFMGLFHRTEVTRTALQGIDTFRAVYQQHYGRNLAKEYAHFCIDADLPPTPDRLLGFAALLKFPELAIPLTPLPGSTNQREQYVYAVQSGKTRSIKLGRTSSAPEKRLGELQTSSPHRLTLLYAWSVEDPSAVEKALHKRFAHCRQRGEWFTLPVEEEAELLAFMANYPRFSQTELTVIPGGA